MIQTVIELLNEARLRELETIDQYMVHHNELRNKDSARLAPKIKEMVIVKMRHAEKLAERIFSLKGKLVSKTDTTPEQEQEVPEMLATDVALEEKAVKMYKEAALICASERDTTSEDLFEQFLGDEEAHLRFFETIKADMEKLGAADVDALAGK
jgi:bacterioferritin